MAAVTDNASSLSTGTKEDGVQTQVKADNGSSSSVNYVSDSSARDDSVDVALLFLKENHAKEVVVDEDEDLTTEEKRKRQFFMVKVICLQRC